MKIYFTASISQMTEEDQRHYRNIVEALEDLGHKVIADHVMKKKKDGYKQQTDKEALEIQRQLSKWKKQADLVVAEITNPSLGVGQEISQTLATSKPVIALYHETVQPHILKDEGGDLLLMIAYNSSNIKESVRSALDYASEKQDTRFNFFISPKHQRYLDWIAKTRKTPRAVYLRRLIDEDMKGKEDYEG